MEQEYREVEFVKWCNQCKHVKKKAEEEPCNECIENTVNLFTDKPVKWEEK